MHPRISHFLTYDSRNRQTDTRASESGACRLSDDVRVSNTAH